MKNDEYNNHVNTASEILKALCHPARFCIVSKLTKHQLNVSQMQSCLNVKQANVSQHLAILRSKGIIKGDRKGNEIFYYLADDHVKQIVEAFFDINEIPD